MVTVCRKNHERITAISGLTVRIAIIHDWLVTYAGSERVLEQFLALYPEADLFALVDFVPESERAFLGGRAVTTSFIQRLPFARKRYRMWLPLMPLAVEQFDFSDYDLVISSSHAVAKGAITGPDQLHISYVHSPMRYAWDLQTQYLRQQGLERGLKGWIAKWLLHKIRIWDQRTANGVNHYIANSRFIARRINKTYRRNAHVIYPPVDVEKFKPCFEKENFYLTASRLVPYKRIDLIVQAFSQMPDRQLVVIGDGPESQKIRSLAGPNITFLGRAADPVMVSYLQRAKAFVFAAEEDFGILPVEAQACGTPVIALAKGGALETVRGHCNDGAEQSGVFFAEQNVESICDAVSRFETLPRPIEASNCRSNAERFGVQAFHDEVKSFIEECVDLQQRESGAN